MIKELYADGGVIGSNPSMIGGTFAYRFVMENGNLVGNSSVLTVHQIGGPVSNNQTELMALLAALGHVSNDWAGIVYSDSQVSLGRLFLGWKWTNIPTWMHKMFISTRHRLLHWDEIKYVLLDGHPTKAQLAAGIGKRGHPVSEHNVWCDLACREAGEAFLANIGENIPSIEQEILVS